MKKTVLQTSLLLILQLCFFLGGYYYSQSSTDKDIEKVINWNTKHIQSVATVSVTESNNAELMIQILNALEGRPVKKVSRNITLPDFNKIEGDEDVPVTIEQVLKDKKEVNRSIRSLGTANVFQSDTLHTILDKVQQAIKWPFNDMLLEEE